MVWLVGYKGMLGSEVRASPERRRSTIRPGGPPAPISPDTRTLVSRTSRISRSPVPARPDCLLDGGVTIRERPRAFAHPANSSGEEGPTNLAK